MKTTLEDISKETGYSISTVSRVLNGRYKSSSETQRKIIKSARNLNYPIQNVGTEPEFNITNILLATGFEIGEFYASYFEGLNQAAGDEGVRLSHLSFKENSETVEGIIEKLNDNIYEGLIINIPTLSREDYERLIAELPKDFPIVSNCFVINLKVDTVIFDNYGGGYQVANHFLNRNYKSFGIIKGPENKVESHHRFHGFKDRIIKNNSKGLIWECPGDYTYEAGRVAFDKYKNLEQKPRAIFASNDVMCEAFIKEAQIEGFSFPEDIAIAGYDDLPFCTQRYPTITSIHTSFKELGIACINHLKSLREKNIQKQSTIINGIHCILPVSLKIRESS